MGDYRRGFGARSLTAIIVAIFFMTSAVMPMISTAETGQTTAAEENIDSFIIHCYVSDDDGAPVESALVIFTNMRTGNAEYVETNDTNLASVDVAAIDGGCIAFDTISIVAMGDLSSANTTVVVDPDLDEVTVTLVLTDYSQPSLPPIERDLVLPTIGSLPLQWNETRDIENETDVPPTPRGENITVNITPPATPPPEIPKPSEEIIVLPNPDFTIKSLKTSELTILEGDVVSTKFFIDNVGLLWYEEIPVAIYDGDISPENLVVIDTAVFEEFSTDVSFILSNLSKGTHTITVFVDPYDEVEEQNEENNTLAFTVRVTTTEDWPLSIIELIELLMAKVDATLDEPYSDIVNNNLMKAIDHLEDATEEYENGDIEDAIESVNDAMDGVYKAATEVKQLYKKGEISLSDAKDIWGDAGIILERIVDLGRLYLDDPLADEIAKVEKYILEIRISAMIEIPDNNFWSPVEAHLSTSLIHFQEAMEDVAGDKDPSNAIQTGYDALNRARDKLSTLVSEGKIPEEFGNWALEIIEKALLVFAPDVVITPESITIDGLAVVGKTSEISIVVENSGRTDVDEVTVEVYDETENILLASKTIHQLKKDSQTALDVDWTPSEIGTHYIRVSVDPDNVILETIEDNNEVRKGHYVITGTYYINDDVYIPPGQLVRWDTTNATITNPQIVVSGNITIDGTLRVGDDYTVIMNCTSDNEYKIQVNVPGELTSNIGHFTSPGSDLTYSFLVGGGLDLFYSTVQWVWGDPADITFAGGIQVYSNNVDIENSEIFEGKTHGIFVSPGVTPNIISGNIIRNNNNGIFYRENAGGTIDNNNISSNTYGVYCYQASPTIMNNENISWNTYGVYCYKASPMIDSNDHISWNTNTGIYCDQASPPISGNKITNNTLYGIDFRTSSNSIVSSNYILDNPNTGIRCYQCFGTSPTIIDNPLFKDNDCGVHAYKSDPHVENNVFTGHWQAVLGQISSATVHKNNIYGNSWGIEVWDSPSTFVASENTVTGNTYGLWCHQSDAVFKDSPDISENDYGMYIRVNSNPSVTNNTVTANRYGIYGNQSSPSIVDNDIYFNGVTPVFDDMSMSRYIENETVYGPSVGGEMGPLYLDNGNIINCSLYLDDAGDWWLMEEEYYTLNYTTGEIDISPVTPLDPGVMFYAYYNVSGWTADGFWHLVNSSDPLAQPWNISHSGNYSWWYGLDATGNYDNGSHNFGNLTSPKFYLPEDSVLTFWDWYEAEPWYDYRNVWINVSGSGWQWIEEYDNYVASMYSWRHHRFDLSSYGGNQIQIRFSFDTLDEIYNDCQGWYIDDVAVIALSGSGAHFEDNSSAVLSANNITENAHGIVLRDYSTATFDNENLIDSNIVYGLYAENATFEIMESTVKSNQYGIYSRDSIEDGINASSIPTDVLSSPFYDLRTTFDNENSTSPAIATDGVKNYMVWADDREGNYEIYFMEGRARNGGWGDTFQRLTNTPYDSTQPDITIDSSGIWHVVWREVEPTRTKICYVNSLDSTNIIDLYTGIGVDVAYPQIAMGDVLQVVFIRASAPPTYPDANIYHVWSDDEGNSWELPQIIGNATDISPLTMTAVGKTTRVAWHDWEGDYFIESVFGLLLILYPIPPLPPVKSFTWGSEVRLVDQLGNSTNPSLGAGPRTMYLVWSDDRTGDSEIYLKSSIDFWVSETRLTYASGVSDMPKVSVDSSGNAHILWQDDRDGTFKIRYLKANDTGVILVDDTCVTPTTPEAICPEIALDENDYLSILWQDMRDNNWEIYAKYFSSFIGNIEILDNSDAGLYLCEGSSTIVKDNNITSNGLGAGSESITGSGIYAYYHPHMILSNNTIVGNYFAVWAYDQCSCYITNNNISYNAARGIGICQYSTSVAINNTINNNMWAGVTYLSSSTGLVLNNNITENNLGIYLSGGGRPTIFDNIIETNRGYGIFLGKAACHAKIIKNKIINNGFDGISNYFSSPAIIDNEIVHNGYTAGAWTWTGIYTDHGDPDIVNNTIAENNYFGIFDYYHDPLPLWPNVISGNDVTANTGPGMYFYHNTRGRVENNDVTLNQWGIACNRANPPLLDNTVTENTEIGILSIDSISLIEGNEIANNKRGIVCSRSTPTIISNGVIENDEWGILCYDDANATISDNTIEGNIGGGIYAHSSSPLISNNEEITLNGYGIYLYLSSSTISDNNIASNTYDGICSYFSSPTIEDNNISGNQNGVVVLRMESNILDAEYIDGTGYAIVIGSANNFGRRYIDADSMPAQTLQAYYTLKNMGYTDDRITFMLFHDDEPWTTGCEPGEDNDGTDEWISIYNMTVNDLWGLDGIQGTADDPVIDIENYDVTKDRLRAELRSIAENVTSADKVLVYLMNHGTRIGSLGGFYFETGGEIAWEDEMNFWLQEIQQNCSKMYVLVDACFSGSFISSLSDPHRLCVSSAADVRGWAWVEAAPNTYAGSWFFHPFWENISAGYSIQEAYEAAAQSKPYGTPGDWWYDKTVREIQDPQMQENLEGITAGTDPVVITGNDIKDNAFYGIFVSRSNSSNIANNNASNNWAGIRLSQSNANVVDNNNALDNNVGIWLDFSVSNIIVNNTFSSGKSEGIRLSYSDDNIILNNNASNTNVGIFVSHSSGNNITNNNASNNTAYGVYLVYSSGNTVTNNTVFLNIWRGIYLRLSNDNTVTNSSASNNYQGIYLYLSENNTISNNNALNNGYGVWLYYSTNNTATNNTISGNDYGIWLRNANSNTITTNTITNNYYGTCLQSSDSNLIYHNNFINNINQAYDNGINFWDNGYSDPFNPQIDGGNYWSDYIGVDLYSGPNQDIPGSDGIGDTPYMFNFAQDNYPLREQWSP